MKLCRYGRSKLYFIFLAIACAAVIAPSPCAGQDVPEQEERRPRAFAQHHGTEQPAEWVVTVQERVYNKWDRECGGALIDKYWVLTGAFCLEEQNPIRVIIGEDRSNYVDDVKAIVYEPVTDDEDNSDMGLVKLKRGYDRMDKIQYVTLHTQGEIDWRSPCTIMGRRFMESWTTKAIKVTPMGHDQCAKLLNAVADRRGNLMCVKHNGELNYDDYGDTLVCQVNGQSTAVGVQTFGKSKRQKGTFIFTRISPFTQWIEKTRQRYA